MTIKAVNTKHVYGETSVGKVSLLKEFINFILVKDKILISVCCVRSCRREVRLDVSKRVREGKNIFPKKTTLRNSQQIE